MKRTWTSKNPKKKWTSFSHPQRKGRRQTKPANAWSHQKPTMQQSTSKNDKSMNQIQIAKANQIEIEQAYSYYRQATHWEGVQYWSGSWRRGLPKTPCHVFTCQIGAAWAAVHGKESLATFPMTQLLQEVLRQAKSLFSWLWIVFSQVCHTTSLNELSNSPMNLGTWSNPALKPTFNSCIFLKKSLSTGNRLSNKTGNIQFYNVFH